MRRDQLGHATRPALQVIHQPEVTVVGSQADLGTYDEAQLAGRGDDVPRERHPAER